MGIFHRRPLFLLCTVFMLSSLIGLALPVTGKWHAGILLLAAGLVSLFIFLRRRKRSTAILLAVAAVLSCAALLRSHQTFAGRTVTYLRGLEQTAVQVTGTVTDRRGSGGNLTAYTLSMDTVNGRAVDGLAVLTCYYVSELHPGCEVSLTATLIPLEEAAGDGYSAVALCGDGYVAGLVSEDEQTVTVLERNSRALSVLAGGLRRTLAARLDLLAGKDAKGLPSALLLGDRTYLADDVRRDFSRAGVAHLLAISGLHITLLFGILEGLLRLIRIPKRARAVCLGIGALGYLMLLGFPPSATRAAIMLGFTYLSYLLSGQSDPLTSLGVAGAVILAVTPRAVADAGFWMSYLATMGILTVLPLMETCLRTISARVGHPLWQGLCTALLRFACAVAVGVVAMSFTLTVVAAVIGEMSLLSPVSTLLLSPFCALIAVLSPICLLCMGTPVAQVPGGFLRGVSALMTHLAEWMAEPPSVVVSLRHPAVLPVAAVMLVSVLVLLAIRLPLRRRWLVCLPLLAGWTALALLLTAHAVMTRDEISVTYLQPSTASESLVLVSGREGFVCDLSNGSLSSMTASVREAKRRGATELSVLMLTHYHTRTSGTLATILNRETVRGLWMPKPTSEEEYYLLMSCLEKAEAAGVSVTLFDTGECLRVFGEGSISLETAALKRSVQPVLLVSLDMSPLDREQDTLVYCGSAVFESDLADAAAERIACADVVIFGSHGPLFKKPYGEGLDLTRVSAVIFSAHGNAAAWCDPEALPADTPLWQGQKRFALYTAQ